MLCLSTAATLCSALLNHSVEHSVVANVELKDEALMEVENEQDRPRRTFVFPTLVLPTEGRKHKRSEPAGESIFVLFCCEKIERKSVSEKKKKR